MTGDTRQRSRRCSLADSRYGYRLKCWALGHFFMKISCSSWDCFSILFVCFSPFLWSPPLLTPLHWNATTLHWNEAMSARHRNNLLIALRARADSLIRGACLSIMILLSPHLLPCSVASYKVLILLFFSFFVRCVSHFFTWSAAAGLELRPNAVATPSLLPALL